MSEVLEKRISLLEKKLFTLVKTNSRLQIQTDEAIAKLDRAVNLLRKALPHVNFEDPV